MTVDKERLREVAIKATPGPWKTRAERNCPRAIVIAGTEQIADAGNNTHWTDEQCARNAAFIAAASPAVALALLDECAAMERELERWRHGLTIEGDFVCPNALAADNARDDLARLKALALEACEIATSWSGTDTEDGVRIAAIRAEVERG